MQKNSEFDALYESVTQLNRQLNEEVQSLLQDKEKITEELNFLNQKLGEARTGPENLTNTEKWFKNTTEELKAVSGQVVVYEQEINEWNGKIEQASEAIESNNKKLNIVRPLEALINEIEKFRRTNPDEFGKGLAFISDYLNEKTDEGRKKILSEFNKHTQKTTLPQVLKLALMYSVVGALATIGATCAAFVAGGALALLLFGAIFMLLGSLAMAAGGPAPGLDDSAFDELFGAIYSVGVCLVLPIMASVGAVIGAVIGLCQSFLDTPLTKLSKQVHKACEEDKDAFEALTQEGKDSLHIKFFTASPYDSASYTRSNLEQDAEEGSSFSTGYLLA